MEKICFRCNILKPLSDYYKHSEMADGHLNKCKECTKGDSRQLFHTKKHDPEWYESEKDRHRDKYHRLEYREKHKPTPEQKKLIMERYWRRYPEKKSAHSIAHKLAEPGFEAHHWSYNEEHYKDVIQLSLRDHAKIHRYMTYDQSCFKYRTLEGVLLETREQHQVYINSILGQ